MIPHEHSVGFAGGKLVLHLDNAPEPEMLPALIEPLMRAAKEIGDALETQRREGQDEKGDHAGSEEGVEQHR